MSVTVLRDEGRPVVFDGADTWTVDEHCTLWVETSTGGCVAAFHHSEWASVGP